MLPRISKVEGTSADYLLFSGEDLISNHLFKHGEWERHILDVSKLIYQSESSPLILDIGANLGAYAVPVAKDIAAIGGEVICFEPQRIVYYQLCANIILNRLDNCTAHQNALGRKSGLIDIPEVDYSKSTNIGAFSLIKEYREVWGIEGSIKNKTSKVPMICLDELSIDRSPTLMKIDVEGLEIEVLKGGLQFFAKHNYPPILFEAWSGDWFAEGRKEILDLLESLGYKILKIADIEYIALHDTSKFTLEFVYEESHLVGVVRINKA